MPLRSQARIRRDIGRLDALITQHAPAHASLEAIRAEVTAGAALVETRWKAYQDAAVTAGKEIKERNAAIPPLLTWSRTWRSVVLIKIPGALESIRDLPANGATADDVVRLATDIRDLVQTRTEAAAFREQAIAELGTMIEETARETAEASTALPAKQAARNAFSKATLEANTLLVRATEIVRNLFGPTSREYKQFVTRGKASEEEEDDIDSDSGEDGRDTDVIDTGVTGGET